MTTLDQLIVTFSADFKEMEKAFARAERESRAGMGKLNATLQASGREMMNLVRGAGTGLLAFFSVDFAKGIIDAAGGLGELSEQLGVTSDALQALQASAAQNGAGAAQLEAGISRLTREMGEAATQAFDADTAFNKLGISLVREGGGMKTTEEILSEVAAALARLPTEAERAAMAVALFGKGGQALLPLLRELAQKGMKGLTDEAREAGLVIDREVIAKFDAISDKSALWVKRITVLAAEGLGAIADAAEAAGSALSGSVMGSGKAPADLRQVGPRGARPRRDAFGETDTPERPRVDPRTGRALGRNPSLDRYEPFGLPAEADEMLDTRGLTPRAKPQAEAFKEMERAARDYERAVREAGQAANDLFRDPADELAIYKTQIDLSNDAIRDQRAEVDQLRDLVATPWEKAEVALARYNELLAKGALDQETYDRLVNRLTESFREQSAAANEMDSIGRDIGLTFTSAFEDAVVGGKKLRDVFHGLAQDLLRLAIRQQVTEPLLELFSVAMSGGGGAGKSGGGGLFGNLLGGLFNGLLGAGGAGPHQMWLDSGAPLSFFAKGTTSAPPGLAWVGEEGPELVRFGGGERVFNARDSARMTGGDTYMIDARGADAAGLARLEAYIRSVNGSIEKRAVAAVADSKLRGGGLRAALAT